MKPAIDERLAQRQPALLIGSAAAMGFKTSGTQRGFWLAAAQASALLGIATLPLVRLQVFELFGYALQLADAFFVLALSMRTLAWLIDGSRPRWDRIHPWLMAYGLALGLACLASADVASSAKKWVGVVYLLTLALLTCELSADATFARRLALVWIAAASMTALVAFAAVFGFYFAPRNAWLSSLLFGYGSLVPGPYPRVMSTFDNPNMWCNYMTIALAFLLAAHHLRWIGARLFAGVLAILLVACAFSVSPGLGNIALLLGLWMWWLSRALHPRFARLALIGGSAAAALMLAMLAVNPAHPLSEPSVRWQIWQPALATFAHHPLWGVGTGQDVVRVSFVVPSGERQWQNDAHNVMLNVAGQAGIPGLAALIGLTVALLRNAIGARIADGSRRTLRTACLFAFVGAFVYQGLGGSFEDARQVWLLIGCLAAFSRSDADARADMRPMPLAS